eukprot:873015-Prymnesium_polylepis.1
MHIARGPARYRSPAALTNQPHPPHRVVVGRRAYGPNLPALKSSLADPPTQRSPAACGLLGFAAAAPGEARSAFRLHYVSCYLGPVAKQRRSNHPIVCVSAQPVSARASVRSGNAGLVGYRTAGRASSQVTWHMESTTLIGRSTPGREPVYYDPHVCTQDSGLWAMARA